MRVLSSVLRHRRLLLSGVGGLLLLIGFSATAFAAGVLDQTADLQGSGSCNLSAEYQAQTFTAGITGLLDAIEIYASSGDYPVEIRAVDVNGKPTGSALASGVASTALGGWARASFGTPTTVVTGTVYAIVRTDQCASEHNWWGDDADTYANGAAYTSGDGSAWGLDGSISDRAFHTYVEPATTTTITSVSPHQSTAGHAFTVNASVTPSSVNGESPIGEVTVTLGWDSCHFAAPSGSCSITPNLLGTYPLTATYTHTGDTNGDNEFQDSVSADKPYTVDKSPTSLSLYGSPQPAVHGQPIHLVAQVVDTATGIGIPHYGFVEFFRNGHQLCSSNLGAHARATCDLPNGLPTGRNHLTALYSGDDGLFDGSSSSVFILGVNPASTATSVTTSPAAPNKGQVVKFTATVAIQGPGGGMPTGKVQFFVDGLKVGGQVAMVNGQAALSVPASFTRGSHHVRAFYIGTVDFAASSSPSALLYVH
jgi:hypothetical protein